MRTCNKVNKTILFILLSLWVCFIPETSTASEPRIQLLYYFSTTCPHCKQTTPIVSNLSTDYSVQGLLYGKSDPGKLSFPVKKGTKKDSKRYDLEGVPVLVVLMDGITRQVLTGENEIRDVRAFLNAFQKGALTVSEAIAKGPGTTYRVIGRLASTGEYFKNARFSLIDRKQSILIKPWLPLEAVKSPFKQSRPRLMSDILNKPVMVEGSLTKNNDDLQFLVGREIIIE